MSGAGSSAHLVARIGDQAFALPLAAVVEVMRPQPMRALAGAPAWILGLATIRGAAVPVVDAAALIGAPTTEPRRWITVRAGQRVVALACASVADVRELAPTELPPLLRASAHDCVAALARSDGELLAVLESGRLLDGVALPGPTA